MNLKKLLKIYSDNSCNKVYIKQLAANDNSKNQVYLGGNFDVLNILPIQDIVADNEVKAGSKVARFKSKLNFSWTNENGEINIAPGSNLILYPDYPEVRFSGFLKGCRDAPSELMTKRMPNRLLFFAVSKAGQIIGYVAHPESELAKEVAALKNLDEAGVFRALTIVGDKIEADSKKKLLLELKRINALGWINSKGFDKDKNYVPCLGSNCGGVTLETELGITANSRSEPDYLGWEIKQFAVTNFQKVGSKPITLMTPEPTHGIYVDRGAEFFIRTYGYPDKRGREARINFGGIYKFNQVQKTTQLKLVLSGYNIDEGLIENSEGFLGLVDLKENIVASWSFASLLVHWNLKHANACYVPSIKRAIYDAIYTKQYWYSNIVMLGTQTDFSIFLKQVALGNIYYDPGIKLELAIENVRKQKIKPRSQFRIKANSVGSLYKKNEFINLLDYHG